MLVFSFFTLYVQLVMLAVIKGEFKVQQGKQDRTQSDILD